MSSVSTISYEKQSYKDFHFRRRYIDALQEMSSQLSRSKLASNECVKILFTEPNFPLKPMSEWYSDERVRYFTQLGLEKLQVYLINGLFYKTDLSLYNSRKPLDSQTGDGEMIVMDRLGSMFIAPKQRGVFHHSSFFSGQPVAFAALCFIREGKIEEMLRYSGHYEPGEQEESAFLKQLQTQYLVTEQAHNLMKIDSQGALVQIISISSKDSVEDLYNAIAEIGKFNRQSLRLICNSQVLCRSKSEGDQMVDCTIAESPLKNGCTVHAIEFGQTPHQRIFPTRKFELVIDD